MSSPQESVVSLGTSLFSHLEPRPLPLQSQREEILREVRRRYPQLDSAVTPDCRLDVIGVWNVPFYPGFQLVEILAEPNARRFAALYRECALFILDARGDVLDRIDAIAPITVEDPGTAEAYLRFRSVFLADAPAKPRFDPITAPVEVETREKGFEASIELRRRDSFTSRAHSIRFRVETGKRTLACAAAAREATAPPDRPSIHGRFEPAPLAVNTPYFVEAWEEGYDSAASEGPGAPQAVDTLARLAERVRERHDVPRNAPLILRATRLSFYRLYRLVEIMCAEDGKSLTSYCLWWPGANESDRLLFLRGATGPVLQANKVEASARGADGRLAFPLDDSEGATDPIADYVAFFYWSRRHDRKRASTPRSIWRLPLVGPVDPQIEAKLSAMAADSNQPYPKMRRVEPAPSRPESPPAFRRDAVMVGAGQLYVIRFWVSPQGDFENVESSSLLGPPGESATQPGGGDRYPGLELDPDWEALEGLALKTNAEDRPASPARSELAALAPAKREITGDHVQYASGALDCARLRRDLRDPGIRRVKIVHCVLESGLILKDLECRAELHVADTLIRARQASPVVDLRGSSFLHDVTFERCQIRGRVHAQGTRFAGRFALLSCCLSDLFAPAHAARALESAGLTSEPPPERLRLDSSVASSFQQLRTSHDLRTGFTLDLTGARFDSDLTIHGRYPSLWLPVEGEISLDDTSVEGDLYIAGVWCRSLSLRSARIEGNCVIGGVEQRPVNPTFRAQTIDATEVRCSSMNLSSVSLSGRCTLRSLECGEATLSLVSCAELDLHGARIERNLLLGSVSVLGSIGGAYLRVGFFLDAYAEKLAGTTYTGLRCNELTLSGAELGGLDLSGAEVHECLRIRTGQIGCFRCGPAVMLDPVSDQPEVRPTRFKRIELSHVRIGGAGVRLLNVRVGDERAGLYQRLVEVAERISRSGVEFENCIIEGDFHTTPGRKTFIDVLQESIADAEEEEKLAPFLREIRSRPREAHITRIVGDMNLRACRFESNVDVRSTNVYGALRLSDSSVALDLQLGAEQDVGTERLRGLRTRCVSAHLEKIDCKGDVDMTGLDVRHELRSTSLSVMERGNGALNMRDGRVRGDLLLIASDDGNGSSGRQERLAHIQGEATLAGLSVSKLAVSGANFGSGLGPADGRLVLERAKVSRMAIAKPLPREMDLTSIQVDRWTDGKEDSVDQYVEILRTMKPLDRTVWVSIEESLRNQGRADEADEVYRAMSWDDHERNREPFRLRVLHKWVYDQLYVFLYGRVFGFGTSSHLQGVFFGVLPWIVILFVLFLDPFNVVATPDRVQQQGQCDELYAEASRDSTLPHLPTTSRGNADYCDWMVPPVLGERWNWSDAAILSLRYSVPVIGLIGSDDWRATDHHLYSWSVARVPDPDAPTIGPRTYTEQVEIRSATVVGASVHTLASIISIYGWLASYAFGWYVVNRFFRSGRA